MYGYIQVVLKPLLKVERQIWRLYIFQIFFRTCIDVGFMVLQYYVYPYR